MLLASFSTAQIAILASHNFIFQSHSFFSLLSLPNNCSFALMFNFHPWISSNCLKYLSIIPLQQQYSEFLNHNFKKLLQICSLYMQFIFNRVFSLLKVINCLKSQFNNCYKIISHKQFKKECEQQEIYQLSNQNKKFLNILQPGGIIIQIDNMLIQMTQTESILRGGGCGSWKANYTNSGISMLNNQNLQNFFKKFNFYVEQICQKAVVAADQSESQEIMIALQWFKFQEENIYSLNKNAQSVVKSYDLIFGGIQKLLNSCLTYIRTDSFKCLSILQTTASLSKVIFSFHVINEERFMKCDLQKNILDLSDEIRQHMEIEKNDLIQNQMELYLFLIKTSFQIAPNNSNEREEILKGCLSGIISSISQMKPNEELLQSLFQGACHLYKLYVINNNKKQYEVYFQIDMLQWEIISYFKNDKIEIYDKIVKNSNDWKYHYLWVQMIGNILQYNPLLTKLKLSQLINTENIGVKSDQIWKEYQRKGLLIQMNHCNDQALILLNQFQDKQLSQIDRTILKTCFKEWDVFLLLKDFLINEKHQNISFTFGSYLKSKLEIQGQELEQNVNIVAINNIKKFLGFYVSNKLLILIQINTEKLEEAIKLCRNFTQDKQYDENLKLKILSQQIQKIIQNLDIYLQNTQVLLKIMRLNQSKQKNGEEVKNFEKFNKLLRLQQILQLYIILDQDQNQDQGSQTQHQKIVIANNDIEEWRKLIFDELNNIDFKEDKFSSLQLTSNLQNSKKKIRREVENLIENYQKEIQKLELSYIQNDLLQYFQILVNNLNLNYENKYYEFQNHFSEYYKYLQGIMIIMSKIETVPSRVDLKKVKQALSDLQLLKFLEKLRQSNLKLKLNLVASKKSFSFLLEKAKLEELRKLSEIINLNRFLFNIIEEFPERIMTKRTNFDRLIYTELQNIEITGDDFEFRLSKQKGIIKSLLFKQSLNEKQFEQVGNDLEMFEKEFGDQFTKQSFSLQKIQKIFQDLEVDKSKEKMEKKKLNSLEIKLEKEKYEMFLSQLKEIEDFRKFLQIENWNKLKQQTETVIQTLEKFECPNKTIFLKLINLELNQLQTLISQQQINHEEQQVQISPIRHERVDVIDNDKCFQIELIQQIHLEAGKSENVVDTTQNGQKFNFSSNESYRVYLSFITKVVKIKQLIMKEEMVLLSNLLEEVTFFSNTFCQIEKYEKTIQTEFQDKFQDGIKEFIKKLEQLQFSYVNLEQKKDENFHSYMESLEIKLFNREKDQVATQIKINIFDFLDCLEFYLLEKLAQTRCFSNFKIEQDFLIQQIKKLYCEESSEEFEKEEESNLLDNLVQRFQDFKNNEQWKIKQGLVFTIIQISTNCFSDSITSFCQKVLIQLWVQEKDQRIRNFLKNQQLISMQMQILQKDWSTQHDRIAKKMQEMLRRIDELQEQISHEANLNKRDLYLKELDETTEQLDQQIENISEMGQQLRLITDFVNHIRKGLIRIEGKINEMKEQLNTIGNDIKFLRGKSIEQLFEIRKWKVLKEAAYKNAKSIYVPLQTQEIGKEEWSILMNFENLNDPGAEVNEFLLQELPEEKKTVLLIHGQAGSGKSTTAKKIEEFIWKLHNNNQKIRNQVLIPVYISLPSLKNPVFQAVDEALRQDEYGFDWLQLKECKELLKKKEFKFLLIMDSYDEMKLEHIQKNLYLSNKVNSIWSNPLVIFTTRSDIFTSRNYTTWFQPEKKEELKEVQLLKFNEAQMKQYLKKYTIQTIKMKIFEVYEQYIEISNRGVVDIKKFDFCWEKFISQFQISEVTSENLLNEKQIESILQFLQDDELIALKSIEALRSLRINLQKLWSFERYEQIIRKINLNQLVETPYMMEIVVQVLPDMVTKATEINNVKQNFLKNFPNMLKVFQDSQFFIQMYKMHQKQLINKYNFEIGKENYNTNQEDTFTDLENLEIINYQEITQKIWNLLEENLVTIQFHTTKEVDDLKTKLAKINIPSIFVLSNNIFEKIADQEETIISVVCDALQQYNLTSYDFYEEFINQYHLTQIEKLKNLGKSINISSFVHDLNKFSIELAKNMSFRQVTQIQYQQKGLLYFEERFEEEWLNQFFNDYSKNGNYKKDVRSCSLIRQKGANFSFVHKSIQEFLIASDLLEVLVLSQNLNTQIFSRILQILVKEKTQSVNTIKCIESWMQQSKCGTFKTIMQQTLNILQIIRRHELNKIDYSTIIYKETRKYMISKIQKKEQIIEFLKFLVYLTAFDTSYIICGSNSLNLLVEMQVDLTSHNFEKIRIKNTSLIGGNFAKCNLSQSEFDNVNINGINLNGAQMFHCNWKNLQSNDLHSLIGHSSAVASVNFSPDGTILASGSYDNSIRLWDVKTGQQKAKLDGHSNYVMSVNFSPDSTTLASGSYDNSIRLWDVKTGQQKAKLDGHSNYVMSVNFSPDGTTLASGSYDKSIHLWDVKTGQQKAKFDGHSNTVYSVNFSPDGTTLASGSYDNSIRLWDVKTGQQKPILEGHSRCVRSVCFSPDAKMNQSFYGMFRQDNKKPNQLAIKIEFFQSTSLLMALNQFQVVKITLFVYGMLRQDQRWPNQMVIQVLLRQSISLLMVLHQHQVVKMNIF
ncbi:unnamed protein product, partial (macronuclear) [Paramecium tetraurelia]